MVPNNQDQAELCCLHGAPPCNGSSSSSSGSSAKSPRPPTWTELHAPAWDVVLDQLSRKDLAYARLACSAWARDVADVLRQLELVDPSWQQLRQAAEVFPRLLTLKLRLSDTETCAALLGPSPEATHSLQGADEQHHQLQPGTWPPTFPYLTRLILSGLARCSTGSCAAGGAGESNNTVAGMPEQAPWDGCALGRLLRLCGAPALRRLHLYDCQINLDDLRGLKSWTGLRELYICHCDIPITAGSAEGDHAGDHQRAPPPPLPPPQQQPGSSSSGAGTCGSSSLLQLLAALPPRLQLLHIEQRTWRQQQQQQSRELGAGPASYRTPSAAASGSGSSGSAAEGAAPLLPSLHHLTQLRVVLPLQAAVELVEQVPSLPHLTALSLHALTAGTPGVWELDSLLPVIVSSCHSLRRLRVRGHTYVSDRNLRAVACGLPHLESLDLDLPPGEPDDVWSSPWASSLQSGGPCGPLTAAGVEVLTCRLPHLSQLHLGHVPMTKCGARAVAGARHLEALSLAGSPHVDDSLLYHLHCRTALRRLCLSGCRGLSDIGLAHLARTAPRLRHLDVSGCDKHVTDVGVVRLSGLRRLRHLNLAFCERVTDAGLQGLLGGGGMPSLHHINLACCTYITDAGVQLLAARAPALHHLDVSGCTAITPRGMASLGAHAASSQLRALVVAGCAPATQAAAWRLLQQAHWRVPGRTCGGPTAAAKPASAAAAGSACSAGGVPQHSQGLAYSKLLWMIQCGALGPGCRDDGEGECEDQMGFQHVSLPWWLGPQLQRAA